MVDQTTISAALNSIKIATEITTLLRESDPSIDNAELKLQLSDLVHALADAKLGMIRIEETLAGQEKRIAELEEALESKDTLVRHYDAYYRLDKKGKPSGVPFCIRCWENEYRKRQLVMDVSGIYNVCTTCSHRYDLHRSTTT